MLKGLQHSILQAKDYPQTCYLQQTFWELEFKVSTMISLCHLIWKVHFRIAHLVIVHLLQWLFKAKAIKLAGNMAILMVIDPVSATAITIIQSTDIQLCTLFYAVPA